MTKLHVKPGSSSPSDTQPGIASPGMPEATTPSLSTGTRPTLGDATMTKTPPKFGGHSRSVITEPIHAHDKVACVDAPSPLVREQRPKGALRPRAITASARPPR